MTLKNVIDKIKKDLKKKKAKTLRNTTVLIIVVTNSLQKFKNREIAREIAYPCMKLQSSLTHIFLFDQSGIFF